MTSNSVEIYLIPDSFLSYSLAPKELSDLLLYLADIAATLKAFVDVYPPVTQGLVQTGFLETLVTFYEAVIPAIQKQWLAVRRGVTELVNNLPVLLFNLR